MQGQGYTAPAEASSSNNQAGSSTQSHFSTPPTPQPPQPPQPPQSPPPRPQPRPQPPTFPTSQSFTSSDPTPGPSTITLKSSTPYTSSIPQPLESYNGTTQSAPTGPSSSPGSRAARAGPAHKRGGMKINRGGRGCTIRRSGRTVTARQPIRLSTRTDGGSSTAVQKLKLSFKSSGGGDAPGARRMSHLGEYDRELDEDPDDPLVFEEQFILRVPKEVAEGPNGLRESVKGKGKGLDGIEFKFVDSRRAAFKFNGFTYSSKLVDLPNIIESQKTFDNRHLFKVADISQMLVVDRPVKDESNINASLLKIDEYIWPHGISPPLRHVRKRRFRKRLSRRTIEVVEEHVEELLKLDEEAESTAFDLIDAHPDPDVADSYYVNYDPDAQWQHQGYGGSEFGESEMYDDPGSVAPSAADDWGNGQYGTDGDGQDFGDEDEDRDEEDGFDEELAAALMEGMEGDSGSGESDDGLSASEEEDDEDGAKSEDDDDTVEKKAKIRQFTSEIKALETAIEKKRAGFTGGNPIMMKRFEETITGLEGDIRTKVESRKVLNDELAEAEAEKQGAAAAAAAAEAAKGSMPSTDKGQGATSASTPAGDDDVDMDDAEGEDVEIASTPTPAAVTPAAGKSSAPTTDVEGGDDGEEDDDLFGDEGDESAEEGVEGETDGDADGEDDGEGGDRGGSGRGGQESLGLVLEGGQDDDHDDEMAAMLNAELGNLPASSPVLDEGGEGPDEQAQADATAALNDFALLGGLDAASSPGASGGGGGGAFGFGVEGGVGMRRLASGMPDDGEDDDSSDDSDD